jgi:formamidopyrimidine-DNA glycosylase
VPELPDIELYLACLREKVQGQKLTRLRIMSLFLLRSVSPKPEELAGLKVIGLRRLGKRIVFEFENDIFVILHLMIAGRLSWSEQSPKIGGKDSIALFEFENGFLVLTEAGSKKRASLHLVRGEAALKANDPGGLEPLDMTKDQFIQMFTKENRTLKRALTNPRFFSGIGNAFSDEILHAARLSPLRLTLALKPDELDRLYHAVQDTLRYWRDKLIAEFKGKFPSRAAVTAFRPDFAVHGRFGKPCPVCGAPVQRIRYAENECDYCARCQTEDRVLADRALSRLLKDDWPRSIEELMKE